MVLEMKTMELASRVAQARGATEAGTGRRRKQANILG